MVQQGTYTGAGNRDIRLGGKKIMLVSEAGPGQTVIDCQFLGRGVVFDQNEGRDSVLHGMTIINGIGFRFDWYSDAFGGGILMSNASPSIVHCVIAENVALPGSGHFSYGGGLAVLGTSAPLIQGCVFEGNSADYGGGIYIDGDGDSPAVIRDSIIHYNGHVEHLYYPTAIQAWRGGGIYAFDNTIVSNNIVSDNWSIWGGGGITVGGESLVAQTRIESNESVYGAGGIEAYGDTVIEHAVIEDNALFDTGGNVIGVGGGVYLANRARLRDSTIAGNIVPFGVGGGIYMAAASTTTVERCVIVDNHVLDGYLLSYPNQVLYGVGGGVFAGTSGNHPFAMEEPQRILSSHIAGNYSAGSGGGIAAMSSMVEVDDCLVEDNLADFGGGVSVLTQFDLNDELFPTEVLITNSVVRGNVAWTDGGGVFAKGTSPLLSDCLIVQNEAKRYGGGIAVEPIFMWQWANPIGDQVWKAGSSPIVASSIIAFNIAPSNGSAIAVWDQPGDFVFSTPSTPLVAKTRIYGNHGSAAIRLEGAEIHAVFRNCAIVQNISESTLAGFSVEQAALDVLHCTVSGNRAQESATPVGSAFHFHHPSPDGLSTIVNSIIWGNMPAADQIFATHTNAVLSFSCHEGNFNSATNHLMFASGNISTNPAVTRTGHLLHASPMINAANPGLAAAFDIDGEVRPHGGGADMGCDEFHDTSGDGFPDWWVLLHFGGLDAIDPDADLDGDGLTNLEEYMLGSDPTNSDTSGNGFDDGWLVMYGYDPLNPDAIDPDGDDDGDGLTNWQEYILGSDPTNWDTSGNGISDGVQFADGHDPSDPMDGSGHGWFFVIGNNPQDVVKINSRSYTISPGETWSFDIVLHSEEYPEWTGGQSQFNDLLTWTLTPSQGPPASNGIDVNSRHQHWVIAEQQGKTLLGFAPAHLEETIDFTAPGDNNLTLNVVITAKNVADNLLPSTVIIYPRPNPPLENTADETEHHDPGWAETRDPINVINGNVTLSERDLFIPAPGIPLVFTRHYHSRGALDEGSALGAGWRHAFDHYLYSRTNATYKGVAGDWLVLSTPDGGRHWFREDNGDWLSPPENNLRLTQAGPSFHVESPGGLTHVFDANGTLQSVSDVFGNTLTLDYTGTWPALELARVEHGNGQYLDFTHNAGRITGIATPSGDLSMSLQYDANGLLTDVVRHISGSDASFAYHYDSVHSVLTQRVNAVGHRFDYGYNFDAPDGPRGISMQLEGQYYAHTLSYTNQGPNRTEVTYDRDGVPQSFVYAYDSVRKTVTAIYGPNSMDYGTLLARDERMNVTGETLFDAVLGEYLVTGREFDARNNVTAESIGYNQAPATQRWHYAWHEDWNLPVEVTDPDGVSLQWEYANARPVIARMVAPGETDIVTSFGYTPDGLPAAVTNAAGHATAFAYDALGNLERFIPPAGPSVDLIHNVLGHLESIFLPHGTTNRVTTFDTDAAGRVTGITLPDSRSATFRYDLMGNLAEHTDAAGRTNRFEYLPAGRLAEATRYLDGQPVGIRTDFDSQFNLLRVTDQLDRNVETYVLDIRDRVVAVTNLEAQVMSVQYGVGDIVHSVTRFDGSIVSNVWDNQARLVAQVLPDVTNTFSYTPGGRLASATGGGVTVTNLFDGFMRVVQEHTLDYGPARAVAYAWNPVGTVAEATGPAGVRAYGYDPAERLTSLDAESGSFAWTYNPDNGLMATVENIESGIEAAYAFDITDRLTNIAWTATAPEYGFAMRYSAADMITNVVHASGEKRVYVYDDLDRLTGERHYDVSEALTHSADYAYDLAGNRTQTIINGVTNTYALGLGNRLSHCSSGAQPPETTLAYAYNLAGCVTSITDVAGKRELVWDGQYRLTAVSTNGALAEAYGYDPLGRRAWTSDGSVTNWHVYDGMHVVADLDDSGTVHRSYTWGQGIDNLLAITVHDAVTNTYYAITDHLGTVHALVDDTGDIVESYRFDAWGNVLGVFDSNGSPLSDSAIGNRFLFQGREYSWATGLYNFRARWYDPITGRWLSNDPIGINGGLNQYVAFGNNPVMFRDAFGLSRWAWFSNSLAAVGGVLQVTAGVAILTTTGWTVVGGVAGGILIAQGGSSIVAAGLNMRNLARGEEARLNTSGAAGLVTSIITDDPLANAIASGVDIGSSLLAGAAGVHAARQVIMRNAELGTTSRYMMDYNNFGTLTSARRGLTPDQVARAAYQSSIPIQLVNATGHANSAYDVMRGIDRRTDCD